MNTEQRYIGGRTAEVSEPAADAFHINVLQNAMMLVASEGAPSHRRIEALSIVLAAYTDRGLA